MGVTERTAALLSRTRVCRRADVVQALQLMSAGLGKMERTDGAAVKRHIML